MIVALYPRRGRLLTPYARGLIRLAGLFFALGLTWGALALTHGAAS